MSDTSSRNEVSGALEALGPTELTLMAVALLPIERLELLIQDVVAEAQGKVKTKVMICDMVIWVTSGSSLPLFAFSFPLFYL
jgi:hypothetical protein